MAILMANEAADRVPVVVTRTGRRRQFSEEDKRRIVEETCRPGQSLSAVARRYGIDLRLFPPRWMCLRRVRLAPGNIYFCGR